MRRRAGAEVVVIGLDDIRCGDCGSTRMDLRVSDRENIWPSYTGIWKTRVIMVLSCRIRTRVERQTMTTTIAFQRMALNAMHMLEVKYLLNHATCGHGS